MVDTNIPKLRVSIGPSSYLRGTNDKLRIERQGPKLYPQALSISFQRTVRVADNGETNDLPPSLGTFPIYETESYEDKLPKHMAGKPGYFIPMYRK